MINKQHHEATITSRSLGDEQRVDVTSTLFGLDFPLRLEPCVFGLARRLSKDYQGGLWHFHVLSNGGFYMAPDLDSSFAVSADNGFEGPLSPDAFGIVVSLYAYSGLSFAGDAFAQICAEHYHLLRAFALDHAEVGSIMAATD